MDLKLICLYFYYTIQCLIINVKVKYLITFSFITLHDNNLFIFSYRMTFYSIYYLLLKYPCTKLLLLLLVFMLNLDIIE